MINYTLFLTRSELFIFTPSLLNICWWRRKKKRFRTSGGGEWRVLLFRNYESFFLSLGNLYLFIITHRMISESCSTVFERVPGGEQSLPSFSRCDWQSRLGWLLQWRHSSWREINFTCQLRIWKLIQLSINPKWQPPPTHPHQHHDVKEANFYLISLCGNFYIHSQCR